MRAVDLELAVRRGRRLVDDAAVGLAHADDERLVGVREVVLEVLAG